MDRSERIVTSETGGQKGTKLAQLGALDPLALLELAEVAGMGAEKYSYHNFMRGYDWNLSFDALQRHALLWWNGEDDDPESGHSHMAHVAWHALCLVSFSLRGVGRDTRHSTVLKAEDREYFLRRGGEFLVHGPEDEGGVDVL